MAKDIRATRINPILQARSEQLGYNIKAIDGGKPYIEARLSRHPCESDVSWTGGTGVLGGKVPGVIGRKDRSFFVNYAGRIARKVNQLMQAGGIRRDGINPEFELDASATGMPISSLMDRVSEYLTSAGWAWISVDRLAAPTDENGNPIPRSVADREASGDRVWWNVWSALDVVDWAFDQAGRLVWCMTEQMETVGNDPTSKPVQRKVRKLWERGQVTELIIDPNKPDEVESAFTRALPFNFIPFVPVGIPSASPWWFDDVEMVCASLLNLESSHNENLLQSVFPQMVMPMGIVEEVMRLAGVNYDGAIAMARGLNFPIMEPEGSKGLTRFIQPNAADMKAIPDEITRRRKDLFEIVGMQLRVDTSQVESAEAKRLGLLDVSAVLAQRSGILETAERRAVMMSRAMDSNFAEYKPVYPRTFDVGDVKADLESLLLIQSLPLPDVAQRAVNRVGVSLLAKVGKLPAEEADALRDAVEEAGIQLQSFASAPPSRQPAPSDDEEDDDEPEPGAQS